MGEGSLAESVEWSTATFGVIEARAGWPTIERRQWKGVARPHLPYGRRTTDTVRALPPLPVFDPWALRAKRRLDLVLAMTLLVVASPILAVIAMAVRLTSRGPVLFRQERVGADGKTFVILKFRTMAADMQDRLRSDPVLWEQYVANDFKLPAASCSFTPIGNLLRKTSLDELPQLFNVVKGEMSLVGVRPLLAEELARRPIISQCLYAEFAPGMTGLWQVMGRSTVQHVERVELDDRYVETWSLRNDVSILVRTVRAVLSPGHSC